MKKHLTQRQLQILSMVFKGSTNAQIGEELGITENTAKNHIVEIIAWYGAHNRQGAIYEALRCGDLEPPPVDGRVVETPEAPAENPHYYLIGNRAIRGAVTVRAFKAFMQKPVMPLTEFSHAVWGDKAADDNAIRMQIKRLRAALYGTPHRIVTLPQAYRMVTYGQAA